MPKYFDYVVVGGGLAGISAALHLQELGAEVVLLEASERLGGRIATDNIDGFLCDRGFQLINSKDHWRNTFSFRQYIRTNFTSMNYSLQLVQLSPKKLSLQPMQ